jgi:hypothetical protein
VNSKKDFTQLLTTYDLSKLSRTYESKDFSLVTNAKQHFSTKQENERFFFYLNAHKAKRKNINKSKTKKKLLA